MASMDEAITQHHFMFEDTFKVKTIDDSRFERAGRIDCESESFGNNLELDINHMIYPLGPGDQIQVAITDNVSPNRARRLSTAYDHDKRLLGPSIMDHYEYVMYGKIYKKDDDKKDKRAIVHASYGGLLMKLRSDSMQLAEFHVPDAIYLLIRKVHSD
mmetsp:Transcript_130682/g.365647  ORF Transcript_130682/g.365647 Transcript_130682/m.365647 type:complete len:158 (-) Transcript_130682:192-665(-)